MARMKYVLFMKQDQLEIVEMPETHAYQLSALNRRLQKEIGKLTAQHVPALAKVIAESGQLELIDPQYTIWNGLDYLNELETSFSAIQEKSYPLISLLTEIRALQAQLEQWYEEESEAQTSDG